MRWRAVAGVLGVAVLAGTVLVLRGQVPPPSPPTQPVATPQPAAIADPGLPVRDPERTPRWRVFPGQRDAVDGVVGPQHLVYTRADANRLVFTVQKRDTGERLLRYAVPHDDAPWATLLHDGLLLIVHGRRQVWLVAINPATGQIRQLAPPQGYSFRPRLVDLGDEVLLLGWQDGPQRSCVLAVQPWTGATRVAWCAPHNRAPAWLYDGVDEVTWPSVTAAPSECSQWQRMRSGGEVQPMRPNPWLCGARGVIDIAGWQVAHGAERDATRPLIVASDGAREVILGTAAAFVGCGRHVYWSAATRGVDPDTVYRWQPGTDHREVAYRLSSTRHALGVPRCTDGVLSVAVTTAGSDPRLVELRALSRP
jgi:hypothetical protein